MATRLTPFNSHARPCQRRQAVRRLASTSRAARTPDAGRLPSGRQSPAVCSPAKWTRPAGAAMTSSSPGAPRSCPPCTTHLPRVVVPGGQQRPAGQGPGPAAAPPPGGPRWPARGDGQCRQALLGTGEGVQDRLNLAGRVGRRPGPEPARHALHRRGAGAPVQRHVQLGVVAGRRAPRRPADGGNGGANGSPRSTAIGTATMAASPGHVAAPVPTRTPCWSCWTAWAGLPSRTAGPSRRASAGGQPLVAARRPARTAAG